MSNIELWISRLQGFNRDEFYIIDRDTAPPIPPRHKAHADDLNARAKCKAWITEKKELENYIHKNLIISVYPNYAGQGLNFEDVPSLFAQAVYEASGSGNQWANLDRENKEEKESKAKKRLNNEIVSQMTLTQADQRDEIRTWLTEIGRALNS